MPRCSLRAIQSISGFPDFGDARVQGGDEEWDLRTLATTFYQHFADAYETLAVVTQSRELTNPFGFHRNVRNGVAGIGLELFDDAAQYGSASVLQAVEVFPSPQWAENSTMLHQQAHQWGEYTGAWAAVGIVRRGDAPAIHTPLLAPGAVMAGAVLEATRRVGESTSSGSGAVIERTLPTIQYNPLTLYRMGLIGSAELPIYQVFEDQGQFAPDRRDVPDDGVAVEGGAVSVTASDFIAADGIRNGFPGDAGSSGGDLRHADRVGVAGGDGQRELLRSPAGRAGRGDELGPLSEFLRGDSREGGAAHRYRADRGAYDRGRAERGVSTRGARCARGGSSR